MSDSLPPARPFAAIGAGARAIVIAQVAKTLIRLVSAALLARLLSPDAYGLHGMAALLYTLLYMARDAGVFLAVQQPGLTRARFNQLALLALGVGLGLAGLCLLLGPPAAAFFAEPRLPPILAGLGAAFVFGGATVAPVALLYKEQRLGTVAAIEVVATLTSTLTALAAAASGAGVWSLVWLSLSYELAVAIGSWWASPWRPTWAIAWQDWHGTLGRGANLTGQALASHLARMVDQVAVGRTGSAHELGLYGRGVQISTALLQLGIAPLSGWGVAALTRAREHKGESALAQQVLNGLFHLCLPPAIVCCVAPELLIRLFYGPQWLAATEVVRWLGLAAAVQPWLFVPSWLLQAAGRTRRLLFTSVLGLVFIGLGCVLAQGRGIGAIALAVAAGTLLHAATSLALAAGPTGLAIGAWLRPAAIPALLHGGFGALLAGIQLLRPSLPATGLLLAAPAYYALAWLAVPAIRREIRHHFLLRP